MDRKVGAHRKSDFALKKYLEEHIKTQVKELMLWPDWRGGQNRIIKLVLLLLYILSNHTSLEIITLWFLLSGHSFLPNESKFRDIESALKVTVFRNLLLDVSI